MPPGKLVKSFRSPGILPFPEAFPSKGSTAVSLWKGGIEGLEWSLNHGKRALCGRKILRSERDSIWRKKKGTGLGSEEEGGGQAEPALKGLEREHGTPLAEPPQALRDKSHQPAQ